MGMNPNRSEVPRMAKLDSKKVRKDPVNLGIFC